MLFSMSDPDLPMPQSLRMSSSLSGGPDGLDSTHNPFNALDIEQQVPEHYDMTAEEAVDTLRKRGKGKKKKNKKNRGGDDSDDDAPGEDDIVEFITPSGEIYELRAAPPESQSKYDVKLHMTNERTFFKFLFSAIHISAIGTFMLNFFVAEDKYRAYVMLLTWSAAFAFVFWGLYAFYHRRELMQAGNVKNIGTLNPHGPAFVLVTFVVVYMTIIAYAVYTHQYPAKGGKPRSSGGPAGAPLPAFLPS